MRNDDGIVIKAGQVYGNGLFVIIAVEDDKIIYWDDGTLKWTANRLSWAFENLTQSHDGADLAAARAEGWRVWVEGMEKPDSKRVSEVEVWNDELRWIETHCTSPLPDAGATYRYKLKAATPQYKLLEIDWSGLFPEIEGLSVGDYPQINGYRIFGFADRPEVVGNLNAGLDVYYDKQPCDHTGNRKYAIGRLETQNG